MGEIIRFGAKSATIQCQATNETSVAIHNKTAAWYLLNAYCRLLPNALTDLFEFVENGMREEGSGTACDLPIRTPHQLVPS
jgi:hypothetical protein